MHGQPHIRYLPLFLNSNILWETLTSIYNLGSELVLTSNLSPNKKWLQLPIKWLQWIKLRRLTIYLHNWALTLSVRVRDLWSEVPQLIISLRKIFVDQSKIIQMLNEGCDTKRNSVRGGTLVRNFQSNLFTKLLCNKKVTEARSFWKCNEV
jgi:hypothetical protein